MIISHFPGGGVEAKPPLDYTYTGVSEYVSDGGNNWKIRFLTSGKFTPKSDCKVDIFAVGGGAGGNKYGGGGGGYTQTTSFVELLADQEYTVTIGAGGVGIGNTATTNGGASSFGTLLTASGGIKGGTIDGGDGGCGGGAGNNSGVGYAGGNYLCGASGSYCASTRGNVSRESVCQRYIHGYYRIPDHPSTRNHSRNHR